MADVRNVLLLMTSDGYAVLEVAENAEKPDRYFVTNVFAGFHDIGLIHEALWSPEGTPRVFPRRSELVVANLLATPVKVLGWYTQKSIDVPDFVIKVNMFDAKVPGAFQLAEKIIENWEKEKQKAKGTRHKRRQIKA